MSTDPSQTPSEQAGPPRSWDEVSSVIDEPVDATPARSEIGDSTVEVPGLAEAPPAHGEAPPVRSEVGDSTVEVSVPEGPAHPADVMAARTVDTPPTSVMPVDSPTVMPKGPLDPHGTSKPGLDMERALAAARLAEAPPTPQKPTTSRPEAPATPTQVVDATVPPKDAMRWQPGEIKLVIEQGLSIGKEFLVSDPEMLVGRRDPDQDFIPDIDLFDQEAANNRYISRRQARLYFRDAQLFLVDLESSNGTAINNRLIAAHEPRQLRLGDKLLFGQSVLLRVKRV